MSIRRATGQDCLDHARTHSGFAETSILTLKSTPVGEGHMDAAHLAEGGTARCVHQHFRNINTRP